MMDQVRAIIFQSLPTIVRRLAPATDRRRGVQWGMVFAGVFMVLIGRFAAFSPLDTLFTQALSRLGLETIWRLIMILIGSALIATAFVPWRPVLVVVYGLGGLVLCWTWVLVGLLGGVSTPTVDVCLGGGIVLLIAAVAKARQSVCVRAFQRTQDGYPRR